VIATVEAPTIAVIDYGIGNLASAQKALSHVGAHAVLTSDPDIILGADGVVLPGVGAFGACMDAIDRSGLRATIVAASADGRPFLGICIGMQLMFEGSEESPGAAGLGLLPGRVERIRTAEKLPQMQWNQIRLTQPGLPLLDGLDESWMYFVHGYAAPYRSGDNLVAATCDYGTTVVAAVASGPVWATQFHPEKSGRSGLRMLRNFTEHVAATAAAHEGGA
jgi:glutamine amidotransferase